MTPENRARRCADVMWAKDAASKALGMQIDDIGPGRAVLSMPVAAQHLNGHGICHGGLIFSLADSAFAFACNSYNRVCVAQHNSITYLAPGQSGDRLIATALEVTRQGRSGIYDVAVTTEDGRRIAEFRGASREVSGVHFEEDT